jgi:acetyl-CoA synthetase
MKRSDQLLAWEKNDYREMCDHFSWKIPSHCNVADLVCDKHLGIEQRIALYYENQAGRRASYTFGQIKEFSNQFANALKSMGVVKGGRVAIVLPQRPEAAIAHLACYKLGAVALPLSVLFGPDALEYRLSDSGASVVITEDQHLEIIDGLRADLPSLESVISCDHSGGDSDFWSLLKKGGSDFETVKTHADDPFVLIYTSGTTGPPKGALVPHRAMLGNLTGFELSHNGLPMDGDLFWTPADWAWTGGLIDALLPAWYYGVPVLGYEGRKFDPERACRLMADYRVRNAFIPPTALKMLRQVEGIKDRYGVDLRSVMSAGEAVGAELYHWGREVLEIEINEMWGQSEFNYIVGNASSLMPVKPGSMGRPYPGHRVEPVDSEGHPMATGEVGELAAWRDDPVMFLGYWKREDATREKFIGNWFGTGDMGYRDEEGYLWFVGREDDVISSAGYRIGPGEIEDSLLKHPAVSQAAVIGVEDDLRGEVVKAFIVPAKGHLPSEALKREIQKSIRERLAAYEYPREVEFIDALPLTTTGKVRRIELRERERSRGSS